jgi:hypothetical protein
MIAMDRTKRSILMIAAFTLVMSACGNSGGDSVASLADGSDGRDASQRETAAVSDEAALLAFGACMRDNGIPDFPDPVLKADGSVDFSVGDRSGPLADVDSDVAEAAVTACINTLEGASFAPGGANFDLTEIQDTFVEFAACMRDNGVEIDDPDFSGLLFGDGSGSGQLSPFGDVDFTDPDVRAALEECRDVFAGLGFGS